MKNLDWAKWASIAEILGAIAIIVTLVYLGAQTRYLADQTEQNNRILRAQAAENSLRNRTSIRDLAIADSEFADFYYRALNGGALSEVDEFRLNHIRIRNFLNWQQEYRLYIDGSLGEGEFSIAGIAATICSTSVGDMREQWSSFKQYLWPEFVLWMEQDVLSKCE